ncbi:hypothetical protein DFJ63DRAFT_336029 [Scheffersomyces coipomensis]|uniref:uncharacterized protein n=1 Tax=Scheffersomyces coipomensis TaxID=1788519 RepID=UPI00315D9E4F
MYSSDISSSTRLTLDSTVKNVTDTIIDIKDSFDGYFSTENSGGDGGYEFEQWWDQILDFISDFYQIDRSKVHIPISMALDVLICALVLMIMRLLWIRSFFTPNQANERVVIKEAIITPNNENIGSVSVIVNKNQFTPIQQSLDQVLSPQFDAFKPLTCNTDEAPIKDNEQNQISSPEQCPIPNPFLQPTSHRDDAPLIDSHRINSNQSPIPNYFQYPTSNAEDAPLIDNNRINSNQCPIPNYFQHPTSPLTQTPVNISVDQNGRPYLNSIDVNNTFEEINSSTPLLPQITTQITPSRSVIPTYTNSTDITPHVFLLPHTNIKLSEELKTVLKNDQTRRILNTSQKQNLSFKHINNSTIDIIQNPFELKSSKANVDDISKPQTSSSHRLVRPPIPLPTIPQTKVTQIQVLNRYSASGGSINSIKIVEDGLKIDNAEYEESINTVYEKFSKRRGSSISTKISKVSNSIDKFVLGRQILDLLSDETTIRDTFDDYFITTIDDYSSMNLHIDIQQAFLDAKSITIEIIEARCNKLFVLNIPGNNEMNQIKFIGELRFFITNEYNGADANIIKLIQIYHQFVDKSFIRFVEILDNIKYQNNSKVIQHLVLLLRDFISIYDASSAIIRAEDLTRCLSLLFEIIEVNEPLKDVIYNSLLSIVCCLNLKSFKVSFLPLVNQLFNTGEIEFKKQFVALECICYYMCLNNNVIIEEFNTTRSFESKIDCCGYKLIQTIHENVKHIKAIINNDNEIMEQSSINSRSKTNMFSFTYKLVDLYLVINEVFLKSNQIPSATQVELLTSYINDIYEQVNEMVAFDSRTLDPPQIMDFIK